MCIQTKVQKLQAQKEALDAQIKKLEKLEAATFSVKNLLVLLLTDYATKASEELPIIWEEILTIGQQHGLSVQPLAADELQQWEADRAELENLRREVKILRFAIAQVQPDNEPKVWHKEKIAPELENLYQEALIENTEADSEATLTDKEYDAEEVSAASLEPEYEPEEALVNLIDRILTSHGFFMPDMKIGDQYSEDEKYEDYQGWASYRQSHDRGVTGIGLYHEKFGFWDASTEMIGEDDMTFPEDFSDGDAILTWLRSVIDEVVAITPITPVENSEVPGQLSLEFPNPTSEQIEEELGCNWEDEEETAPEQTELQKLLAGNSNFTFEELGVSVKIQSVFTEEEIESEDKDESDDSATEKVEEALIIACNAEGRHWRYYVNAQIFTHQCTIDSLEQAALGYAQHFLRDLEKQAKAKEEITQHSTKNAQQSESAKSDTETEFEMMGLKVRVHPQLPMGVTFRFLNPDNTLAFSNSLISAEIGDRTWKICASDLIQNYRDKEAARIDREANPYKKPEDEFVEFVKFSNAVGYLKRRDNAQLIAGYMAFSNKLPDGHRAGTQAKSRAAKWAEWLKGTFELECDAPRIAKRMISDNSKQPFAYEVKLNGLSIGQLTKLAEEDLSLLPGEVEEQQQNTELLRSETKASPTSPGEIEQATEPGNDELTDEPTPASVVKSTFTGLALNPECGLNEDEIELVEMAKAAILECDSEMAKSVNSVFKEVCEKNAANRVKVWNALTEEQQQTYKLLFQMEFAKAPDFAEQTPEYVTYIDGKMVTNVWLSLCKIDGNLARIWRYKGQKDEIGYATKEAAAIAAISQQAG